MGLTAPEIDETFIEMVAFFISQNDEPEAGKIKISSQIKAYIENPKQEDATKISGNFKSYSTTIKKGDTLIKAATVLKVETAQLEFEEGFLTNIVVETSAKDKRYFFTNPVSIGFASKRNITNLNSYELRLVNVTEMLGSDVATPVTIRLGELIKFYDYTLRPLTRDYSPRNGRMLLMPSEQPIALKKEETQKLFEAHVFSDFLGFNQENPNGLIQTEIAKRINTNTYRSWAYKNPKWFLPKVLRFVLGEGAGGFQYVRPFVSISKFEENNKRLTVSRYIDSKTNTVTKYLTALEVLRYQNFSAGLDANLLYFENMPGKFNITMNAGIHFGRTALRDSLMNFNETKKQFEKTGDVKDFGVNTLQFHPELKIQWYPDERFGVSLARRWNFTSILGSAPDINKIGQYKSANKDVSFDELGKNGTWLGTWTIEAFVSPDKEGQNKLFFRYRLTGVEGNRSLNFQQAQVGYSFFLLKNRDKKTGN
ncbi:hypothetical protein [Runella sp.]|uniref:hypothetical protein n=1 Tax=Runella sp. TaxID=1960881 RepID=UPI003D112E04